MDLTSSGAPRRLVWVGVVAGVAAIVCLAAFVGGGQGHIHRHGVNGVPATAARLGAAVPAIAAAQLAAAPAARHARPNPWLINPDAPLPRPSPWRPVLAVARRFAAAYLSYEIGELGPAVRLAIAVSGTAAFAAQLLSDRASLPPGVRADQARQRLIAVTALERVPGAAITLVTVRSGDGARAPSAFELRVVAGPRGWRVAGITVL